MTYYSLQTKFASFPPFAQFHTKERRLSERQNWIKKKEREREKIEREKQQSGFMPTFLGNPFLAIPMLNGRNQS